MEGTEGLLPPKFLTVDIAQAAIHMVIRGFLSSHMCDEITPNEFHAHVVVLVPAVKDDRAVHWPDWPNYQKQAFPLAEVSFGQKKDWRFDYEDIARCKAAQLWEGTNDGGTNIKPHLLVSTETPFWGGVKREGIVVACSGRDEWIDRMISGMVADACIGLAYDAWMKSPDHADKKLCFLT